MECDCNGIKYAVPAAARRCGLKRKCRSCLAGVLRLAFTTAVPGTTPARSVQGNLFSPGAPEVSVSASLQLQDSPFMNNMDEISYWIYTKRAPCLLNYDNIVKKQVEQAQCSTTKPQSVKSCKSQDEPSPRKKRKLKLLDDDSASTEKQQNIYFKTPHNQKTALSSCKSNGDGSDIDFNIKTSSAQKKSKKIKLQRNCQTRTPKKNKVATSTPKIRTLRRSLRTAKRKLNNLNCTFQILNASVVNGKQDTETAEETNQLDKVATNDGSKSKSRSSGASRYPRRHKQNTTKIPEPNCSTNLNNNSRANATGRKYNMRKGALNLDRKENSEQKVVSRARSGRRRGLKLDVEASECPVLRLNSSTEQVSSSHAVNVACPNTRSAKKTTTTSRCLRSRTVRDKSGPLCKDSASEGSNKKLSDHVHSALEQSTPKCVKKVKKTMDKTRQSLRDSLRDKSGFAACFSDSDSDSEPLKQPKFFS
ncbi:uncharacterized protein LOC120627476 isoform X2 [Pararge aegeria]|nr:uncharacterized protein LOC120627476 isoform X2 [Pararge aegeria]